MVLQSEQRQQSQASQGSGRKYGLIGRRLAHSFSPRYFGDFFAREGIDATYRAYELASIEELPSLLAREPDLCGLNVTLPYKREVLRYVDVSSPDVEALQATNVLRIRRSATGLPRVYGYNTDVEGFRRSLSTWLDGTRPRALVFGSGGAASAVLYALSLLGLEGLQVSRHPRLGMIAYEELRGGLAEECQLWINATPVGLCPGELLPLPYEALSDQHLCYDLIYNPSPTAFLREAQLRGAQTKDGLEMLYIQADEAWKIWTTDEQV